MPADYLGLFHRAIRCDHDLHLHYACDIHFPSQLGIHRFHSALNAPRDFTLCILRSQPCAPHSSRYRQNGQQYSRLP
jgi:hypothetical protein